LLREDLSKKTTFGEVETAGELHDRLMIVGTDVILKSIIMEVS